MRDRPEPVAILGKKATENEELAASSLVIHLLEASGTRVGGRTPRAMSERLTALTELAHELMVLAVREACAVHPGLGRTQREQIMRAFDLTSRCASLAWATLDATAALLDGEVGARHSHARGRSAGGR